MNRTPSLPRPARRAGRAAGVLVTLLACAYGQDDPKPDPLLDGQLDILEECLGNRKGEEDPKAIGILSDLKALADAGMHPSDIKKTAKALRRVFLVRRPHDDPRLYHAAATVLGSLGEDGAKVLKIAYDDKRRFPNDDDWDGLRSTLLREIGRTQDPRQVDFLLDTALAAPRDLLLATAGEALKHYADAPLKVRQHIVDRMVDRYASLDAESRNMVINRPGEPQDFGPQNAGRILRSIRAPWNRTLAELTGQSFRSAPDWVHWLNKDGKNPRNWKQST